MYQRGPGMEKEIIGRWLKDNNSNNCSSYGYGCGDGCGYGTIDGYGYVDCSGSGHGYGDGSGHGSGHGSGYGTGRGDGSGYGTRDGYGIGYGNGDGYGCEMVNKMHVFVIDEIQTVCRSIKGNILSGYILNSDLTMEKCYVIKGNGYFAHGKSIKEARSEIEEKIYRNMDADHAIDEFICKFKHNKKYPVSEFYKWHNYLTGSCKMGRDMFAKEHGIDIENDTMTPEEFIELTENDFGGRVIKELSKKFKK